MSSGFTKRIDEDASLAWLEGFASTTKNRYEITPSEAAEQRTTAKGFA